jgi:hypothetical protein
MIKISESELLNAFTNYYNCNSNYVNFNECDKSFYWLNHLLRCDFPNTIKNYTIFQKKLYEIWKNHHIDVKQFKVMHTSGTSSNHRSRYLFGPNPNHWIATIWNTMFHPFGWRPMIYLQTSRESAIPYMRRHELYQWQFKTPHLNDYQVSEIIKVLEEMIKKYGFITLLAVPESYLFLNQTLAFLDFLELHKERINIFSWCWEPFFKKNVLRERKIWFGDNMIDWTSGINFYTCKNGHQHVLPIFINGPNGPINAINMIEQNFAISDNMEITNIVNCTCGLTRPTYIYYPHFKNSIRSDDGRIFFDTDLPDNLQSRYRSLQFIEQPNGKNIIVHYDVEGVMLDKPFLENVIKSYGFDVGWKPESFTMSSGKRIPFFSLKTYNS